MFCLDLTTKSKQTAGTWRWYQRYGEPRLYACDNTGYRNAAWTERIYTGCVLSFGYTEAYKKLSYR